MKNTVSKIFTLLFLVAATTLSAQEKDTNTSTKISVEIKATDTDEELEATAKIFAKENINLKFSKVKRNAKGEIISIKSSYKGPKGFKGEYKISAPVAITSFTFSVKYGDDDTISDISYNRSKKGDIIAMNTDGKSSIYVHVKNKNKTNDEQPLFVIDNVISEDTDIKENLKPDDIKSMNVLKGKSAKEKYGDKGENGVIEITTKKKSKFSLETALIVVDGEIMPRDFDVEEVDSNTIESMNVLKNKSATELYGSKGEDGVIVIKTKKNIVIKTVNEDSELNSLKPLYVIDGKVMPSYYKIEGLKVENIENINVLKDKSAKEKYGDKGKNGVVEITLKN